MTIKLQLLGAPRCFVDDVELLDLPAQKTRFAVLVYLAVERNVAREEAAAVFWGESGEERARHALSQSIYELKRVLGDEWLETRSGRLAVTDALAVDVTQFVDLAGRDHGRAADFYDGPFLSGFFLSNCNGFESWADRQRAQLERLHRKVRRECVSSAIADGDLQAGIELARRWVALDPLEDEANHRLIELLAITGRRAEALKEYEAYERRVREELDIAPLDETRELIARIRQETKTGLPHVRTEASSHASRFVPLPVARSRRTAVLAIALAMLAAGAIAVARLNSTRPVAVSPGELDTTRIALLPFHYAEDVDLELNEQYQLQDALARWEGISSADPFEVDAAIEAEGVPRTPHDALRIARAVGAGLFMLGTVARFGDSLRIHGVLYDARTDARPLMSRTVRVPLSLHGLDVAMAGLVDVLLFGGDVAQAAADDSAAGTRSWAARRALLQGQRAVRDWELEKADSAFSRATTLDPRYVRAFLWLAQVRAWTAHDATRWLFAAEYALTHGAALSVFERQQASALVAFANRRLPEACQHFRQLASQRPFDFAAWFSLATCLRTDNTVVDDPASPSGKSFRTSYYEAIRAYQHAFRINPRSLRSFRARGYLPARQLIFAASNVLRPGAGVEPDTTQYWAYPIRQADTLAFIPFPVAAGLTPQPFNNARALQGGRTLGKQVFRGIAAAWRGTEPNQPDAAEAMAVALEMLGDARAIDTLATARSLTNVRAERTRLAAYEISVLLKFGFPDDPSLLARIALLADSVLRDADVGELHDPSTIASAALLRGRVALAARLARSDPVAADPVPRTAVETATRLLIYSAVGSPIDSVHALQQQLLSFARGANAEARESLRARWLLRSVMLSYPATTAEAAAFVRPVGHYVVNAQQAAHSDPVSSRAALMAIAARRADLPAEDFTFDVLAPEAAILFQTGHAAAAAEWLDPALRTLVQRAPRTFCDPVQTASLLRAAILRAEIAHAMGDHATAARWASAMLLLWESPEPSLQPLVRRLLLFRRSAGR